MLVIPAIDIQGGKCVRMRRGKREECTVYSDDPVGKAREWEEKGAGLLHVVDLDGAFEGTPKNAQTIKAIIAAVGIPVEVGGGIRTESALEEYLNLGASRVVLGTRAYQDSDFVHAACRKWRDRIVLGVDASGGRVAIKGWTQVTGEAAADFAKRFTGHGIAAVIYTDIERDGTLTGVNFDGVEKFAGDIGVPVIASGGVSSLADIRELKKREGAGISGVIVGQALYTGAIDLTEAVAVGLGKVPSC